MPVSPKPVITGNLVVVKLNNKVLGLLQNVRVSNSYGIDPQSGIGDIHFQDLPATQARHNISVGKAMMLNESLESAGVVPQNGVEALKQPYFSIEAYQVDPTGAQGKLLWAADFCKYDSGEVDVQPHRTVMQNATFIALDIRGTWTASGATSAA